MSAEAAAVVADRVATHGRLESVYGFGTVFGKGLRDSRRAVIGVGLGLGLLTFFTASQVAVQFPTLGERQAIATQMGQLPAFVRGLLGEPIHIERLGGFISWRITNFLPVLVGLWSALALSGTLASEAARGSLDLLATTPSRRARLAIEKVLAHVVGLVIAIVLLAGLTALAGTLFAKLAGDEIPLSAALSHFAGTAVGSLPAGAIAFVLAPILGRAAAGAVGAIALVVAYVINSYATVLPALATVQGLSWLNWTAGHRPAGGISDPLSVALVGALDVALLAVGVVVFVRRDIGITVNLPTLALGGGRLGRGGPLSRSFADRFPAAIAWGLGIGLYGLVIAASAQGFADAMSQIPGIARILEQFYPGIDYRSASGVLQLAFFSFAVLLAGLAVAVLVNGWASDERDRRLDVVLSTQVPRARWVLASGAGVMLAVAVMGVLGAALVAAGAAAEGDAVRDPFVGTLVIAVYAAALAGVGIAVGGIVG